MTERVKYKSVTGKTYSLFAGHPSTERYYETVREIVDGLAALCPDRRRLLAHIQRAGGVRNAFRSLTGRTVNRALIAEIRNRVGDALSPFTSGVEEHLRGLSLQQRLDETVRTKEEQYHLFMIEIELVNRIHRDAFKKCDYKIALLPHCLRDFRPRCRSAPGDIECTCMGCTDDCFINLGSLLLRKFNIHPYISITIDQQRLLKGLKAEHPGIGALGIACVPELARGMRLCMKLAIPPVGIPLDANRCARWMKKAEETSFSLEELEGLLVDDRPSSPG